MKVQGDFTSEPMALTTSRWWRARSMSPYLLTWRDRA